MQELTFTIKNEMGIHARPAVRIVNEAVAFPCKITIAKDGREVDLKKIMGVMSLGAKCGQEIVVRCDGEREEEAIQVIRRLLDENL